MLAAQERGRLTGSGPVASAPRWATSGAGDGSPSFSYPVGSVRRGSREGRVVRGGSEGSRPPSPAL